MTIPREAFKIQAVMDRLLRVSSALRRFEIPFALVGGNAVAAWVVQGDGNAVRSTRDVDILLRRSDLEKAITPLESEGFYYRRTARISMFLDGPNSKARDAVHILFAAEKVTPDDPEPAPNIHEAVETTDFTLIKAEALVRMKLVAFRPKDQMHIQDLLSAGIISERTISDLPPSLHSRFKTVLDEYE